MMKTKNTIGEWLGDERFNEMMDEITPALKGIAQHLEQQRHQDELAIKWRDKHPTEAALVPECIRRGVLKKEKAS